MQQQQRLDLQRLVCSGASVLPLALHVAAGFGLEGFESPGQVGGSWEGCSFHAVTPSVGLREFWGVTEFRAAVDLALVGVGGGRA